jgi:hypothetical protein
MVATCTGRSDRLGVSRREISLKLSPNP